MYYTDRRYTVKECLLAAFDKCTRSLGLKDVRVLVVMKDIHKKLRTYVEDLRDLEKIGAEVKLVGLSAGCPRALVKVGGIVVEYFFIDTDTNVQKLTSLECTTFICDSATTSARMRQVLDMRSFRYPSKIQWPSVVDSPVFEVWGYKSGEDIAHE